MLNFILQVSDIPLCLLISNFCSCSVNHLEYFSNYSTSRTYWALIKYTFHVPNSHDHAVKIKIYGLTCTISVVASQGPCASSILTKVLKSSLLEIFSEQNYWF